MRLFFALWPPEEVRAQLARWSRELRTLCGGRATPAENLHLTVAFLGSVAGAAEVERAAREVAVRRATLLLDRAGFWRQSRIVWAGTSLAPAGVEQFARDLRGALARHEIGFDAKPFATHVTLLREAREPRSMPALEPIAWEVDGFVLVRSQPSARGSRYEAVATWAASP
ncbi:MAG TPA: RNA 2',3'-cyclic phosphodiesterase [Burkholderiales bacterium]|nr:RNA 2',3'-cyclic phosphodiesterase [Burkholderiales bacterium]